jgi:Flp pilus assembly protein TadG
MNLRQLRTNGHGQMVVAKPTLAAAVGLIGIADGVRSRWHGWHRLHEADGLKRCERGSSLIECALILPVFTLLLAGAVDFGRAWYINLEISSAAEAGVLYGIHNLTDVTGMNAAAAMDAPDVQALQVTSTYGNECSDGSSAVPLATYTPICSANVVSYVEVNVQTSYKPMLNYPGLPASFALGAKFRMRAAA